VAGIHPRGGNGGDMPMGKLTVATAKALRHDPAKGKRPVRFGDGDGLYLQIAPGSRGDVKSWLFRFKLHGKEREMGLGPFGELPDGVPLADARKRAAAARALLARRRQATWLA
jgi:hypothetical protein